MLDLNYYFIDVGYNSIYIEYRKSEINMSQAKADGDKPKLVIGYSIIKNMIKDFVPLLSPDEFKVVMVNKMNKISVEIELEDVKTIEKADAVVKVDEYDIYIMYPGQRLTITCEVVPREKEIRCISYKALKPTTKSKQHKRKH